MQLFGKGSALDDFELGTRIVHGGMHPEEWTTDPFGRSVVNPPVYHASTVLHPNMAAVRESYKDNPFKGMSYGRHGTPTSFALEEAFAVLEGADNACCVASGVAAINVALLAFLQAGDHILVSDGVYDPTRSFCDGFLQRFGVARTYFAPAAPASELASLFQNNTKVLFLESPSSLTFEIHDFAALAEEARKRGAIVIADNTWGPSIFRPLEHGAHVTINAGTKYISGHSDAMMGLIGTSKAVYRRVKKSVKELGCPPGPDDCYLVLRGLKTLHVRMPYHGASALEIARWLEGREEVARVMHPALASHPQHEIWARDFKGAAGLFSFQLSERYPLTAVHAFVDSLRLFGIGFSWGGFESLIMLYDVNLVRSVAPCKYGDGYGAVVRLQIGLEDTRDLRKDLERGFEVLESAAAGLPGQTYLS